MSLRQQAIQGVFWTAVQNWGSSLLGVVVMLILARLLGPELYGLVAYAAAYIGFLSIFQRLGTVQALIQRERLEPDHISSAFWLSAASGLLLTLTMIALSSVIATLAKNPPLTPILQWLSLTLLIDALGTTPQACLRRDMAFRTLAVRSIVSAAVGGAVGVVMALWGYGVWALVAQRIIASLASTITLWTAGRWRPGWRLSLRHFRDLFGFGMYTMGGETFAGVNRHIGPFLIGIFLGAQAVAWFDIGSKLLNMMTNLFTGTVSAVALPTFSRLQENVAQMRSAFVSALRMTTLLAVPASIGAAVVSREFVVGILSKEEWLPAIPIMRVLSLAAMLQAVTFFNGPLILACGKASKVFNLALISTMLMVLMYLVTVPFGIFAVAVGFVVRILVYAPIPGVTACRLIGLPLREYLRPFLSPLGGSLGMAAVVWGLKLLLGPAFPPLATLLIVVPAGALVYAFLIHLIDPARWQQTFGLVRAGMERKNPVAVEDVRPA